MIINKQNLLQAGATQEIADQIASFCTFPCSYNDAVKTLEDKGKTDLTGWMIANKGKIIETTDGWFVEKYAAMDINNNNWIETQTKQELSVLVFDIQDQFVNLNPNYFVVNLLTDVDGIINWSVVDLYQQSGNANYDVFDIATGLNTKYETLDQAKKARDETIKQYFILNPVPTKQLVVSADKTESAWVINS